MVDAYVKPNAPFALSVAKGLMSDESNPSLRSGRTGQRPWQTVKARGKPSKDVRPTRGAAVGIQICADVIPRRAQPCAYRYATCREAQGNTDLSICHPERKGKVQWLTRTSNQTRRLP